MRRGSLLLQFINKTAIRKQQIKKKTIDRDDSSAFNEGGPRWREKW